MYLTFALSPPLGRCAFSISPAILGWYFRPPSGFETLYSISSPCTGLPILWSVRSQQLGHHNLLQAIEARPGTYACLVRSRPTGSLIGVPTCRFSDSLTVVSEHLRSHSFECASLAQFLNVPRSLGLGPIVINTGRWCYPDKRCFQPHSLAHVDGTFTVAEPHFLTSFHRDIRWGGQYQETNELVD